MSEKYSLEWFLDSLDSRDFKDIDWASLGQLSINAMIRKNGGTVNEDLDYAKADARHWHAGYEKTKADLEDQYKRANDVEKKLNEVLGARKGDALYIQNLEKLNVELEEDVKAYKDYIAILEEQVVHLKDWVNELSEEMTTPLSSDHPALVDAEKSGYERGWNDARKELGNSTYNVSVYAENEEEAVKRLKEILKETREEQQNNLRIHSDDVYRLTEQIKVLKRQLRWHEDNSAKWRDEMTTWLRETVQDILDGR